MTATSSSDRIAAAREALNATQRGNSARGIAEANKHIADLSAALRALIEPPAIEESVPDIVERVLGESRGVRPTVTRAVEAGIQAAWESWEPETANVETVEHDQRITAWYRIAEHPFFEECFEAEEPLIDTMIVKLDLAVEGGLA